MTDYILPVIVAFITGYGLVKKVAVFDVFLAGAKEGLKSCVAILPALLALVSAVGMFKASGAMDLLRWVLQPLANFLGFPSEVTALALVRPLSGSGALAVFESILREHGPDSYIGRVASVLQGSTETTFYTIALYYGAVQVQKTRHTLPCALTADLTGFVMSALAVKLFFS